MKAPLASVTIAALLIPFFGDAQRVPSSQRSIAAIERVKPGLLAELEKTKLTLGSAIYIRIFKEERELELWMRRGDGFRPFKTYPICTYGSGSLGPKTRQGDGQAPEGFYHAGPRRLNPTSKFHLSFDIGYPNRYDRFHKRTGGDIMVHGACVSIGCFAMTNAGIEEIYAAADAALKNGQPFFRIHIFPYRMTIENMRRHRGSQWHPFWENLKEGYDFFEANGNIPPNVEVRNGRYVFSTPG